MKSTWSPAWVKVSEIMKRKVVKGEPVSTGVGMGEIYTVEDMSIKVSDEPVQESEVENQITSLEVAICRTFIEIYDLKDGFKNVLSEEENRIFDFYRAILDDRSFFDEIKSTIKCKRYRAEKAIHTCIQKYMDAVSNSDNEYFKQRLNDLKDVRKRLIKNIFGENQLKIDRVNEKHIVVVKELTPILAAMLCKKGVKGVVAEEGAGYFSHASIILRSLGIPTLNGVEYTKLKDLKGEYAVIDCCKDIIIINPDEMEILDYRIASGMTKLSIDDQGYNSPAVTSDGHRVNLMANISSVKDFWLAKKLNIDGIGLVRTESLFINYKKVPDEKRQFSIYSKILRDMGQKPVVIRTADIGGDKLPGNLSLSFGTIERSIRGIGRSLKMKEELMVQLRSILRASEFGNVSITFPMVYSASEVIEAKSVIEEVYTQLSVCEGKINSDIKIGALIETLPSVGDLDAILRQIDFVSIGTNDLLHQVCGLNRKCSTLEMRSYFEPEFLSTLKYCIDKAVEHKKKVSICGEMASDPVATALLVGMGAGELSMSPSSFENINRVIRKFSLKEAKDLEKEVMSLSSVEQVRHMLSLWIQSRM